MSALAAGKQSANDADWLGYSTPTPNLENLMPIMHCMTCKKKHASNFYRCEECGYTSCQAKDGGFTKCPSCGKAIRKLVKK